MNALLFTISLQILHKHIEMEARDNTLIHPGQYVAFEPYTPDL